MSWPIDARFNIFNDPPGMDGGQVHHAHASGDGQGGVRRNGHCRGGDEGRSQKGLPPPTHEEVRAGGLERDLNML